MLVWMKAAGPCDRAVDVALGGEMHDRARPVLLRAARAPARGRRCRRCTKTWRGSSAQRAEVAQVAGVGELVEVDDRLAGRRRWSKHEVRADEAGAAGDEKHSCGILIERPIIAAHEARSGDSVRRLGDAALAAVALHLPKQFLPLISERTMLQETRAARAAARGCRGADRHRERGASLPRRRAAARDLHACRTRCCSSPRAAAPRRGGRRGR